MWSLIGTFVVGGTIMSAVRFLANELSNPALAAIVALTPIGFLCGYLLRDRPLLTVYVLRLAVVMSGSVLVALLIVAALRRTRLPAAAVLSAGLALWVVVQYGLYRSVSLVPFLPAWQKQLLR